MLVRTNATREVVALLRFAGLNEGGDSPENVGLRQ
jgi:hypothetical protein